MALTSGFTTTQQLVIAARGLPPDKGTRCGFTISGSAIKAIVSRPGVKTFILPGATANVSQVEVAMGGQRAASVGIVFPDQSGTVLAALDGYVANVLVQEGRVLNVTYAPSPQSGLRSIYESESKRLDGFHASAAASAKYGVLRFDGPRSVRARAAAEFAGRIRVLKGVDPTLGIC